MLLSLFAPSLRTSYLTLHDGPYNIFVQLSLNDLSPSESYFAARSAEVPEETSGGGQGKSTRSASRPSFFYNFSSLKPLPKPQ